MIEKILNIGFVLFCLVALCACSNDKMVGMANPWTDCATLEEANKIAGFNFPLKLKNYKLSAMKDMIEFNVIYNKKDVTIRKGYETTIDCDNSGDYTKYPINNTLELKDGVIVNTRRDKNLIYVTHFCAESGCFSIRSPQGLTEKEVQEIFSMISEAESPKFEEE